MTEEGVSLRAQRSNLRKFFTTKFRSCLIHQAQLPNKLGNYILKHRHSLPPGERESGGIAELLPSETKNLAPRNDKNRACHTTITREKYHRSYELMHEIERDDDCRYNVYVCGGRSPVVKAPGCGPGDRGFKSHRSPQFHSCAYSSADKSTGLRNRGSWVRIPLGALKNHQVRIFVTLSDMKYRYV